MMDDPVHMDQSISTALNSLVAHKIKSSAMRDICTAIMAQVAIVSAIKSRSLTASMLFGLTDANPKSLAT